MSANNFGFLTREKFNEILEDSAGENNEHEDYDNVEDDGEENYNDEEISREEIADVNTRTPTQIFEDELNNNLFEDDDMATIEQYETGFFIQDSMMYSPFRMFPPYRNRVIYACHLDTWLRYKLQEDFTEADRNFVMRCLEDLRRWNDGESDFREMNEDDGMPEIFEKWPERIRAYDRRSKGSEYNSLLLVGTVIS